MNTIYKLCVDGHDACYIGKTSKSLKRRITKHKSDYERYVADQRRYISSFEIFELGDVKIVALEHDINVVDINDRERYWIENTPHTVNKNKSWKTKRAREHAFNNSDHRKEYMVQYAQQNAEAMRIAKRAYKARATAIMIYCDTCQCNVSKRAMQETHLKSKRHITHSLN